jgi:hypothetical protein
MRLPVALFTFLCLSACSVAPSQQPDPMMGRNDEWRQRQALQDADIILQGMAQARQRADMMARTAR